MAGLDWTYQSDEEEDEISTFAKIAKSAETLAQLTTKSSSEAQGGVQEKPNTTQVSDETYQQLIVFLTEFLEGILQGNCTRKKNLGASLWNLAGEKPFPKEFLDILVKVWFLSRTAENNVGDKDKFLGLCTEYFGERETPCDVCELSRCISILDSPRFIGKYQANLVDGFQHSSSGGGGLPQKHAGPKKSNQELERIVKNGELAKKQLETRKEVPPSPSNVDAFPPLSGGGLPPRIVAFMKANNMTLAQFQKFVVEELEQREKEEGGGGAAAPLQHGHVECELCGRHMQGGQLEAHKTGKNCRRKPR